MAFTETHPVGLEALGLITRLLQRIRTADPVAGSYDAAEVQWEWRYERHTDETPQLV